MENNTPVYIKGGAGDKLLLSGTIGLIGVGLLGVLQTIWMLLHK